MKCPYCGAEDTRVIDSRSSEDGLSIRRRRVCEKCGKRFTTYEKIETMPIIVIKKDGSRQEFDRQKLIERILRACQKRKVSMESINRLADEIEGKAINSPQKEISTTEIGELVLLGLWKIDEVAYVRFASVYRDFDSLETFIAALNELKEKRLEEALTPDLTEDAPEGEEA
ncbi:MAG: transcriptional repressor NrdR [Firmicutes bacterium]|nr:transcriptional repressor NrdR [Bacillota bacterium]